MDGVFPSSVSFFSSSSPRAALSASSLSSSFVLAALPEDPDFFEPLSLDLPVLLSEDVSSLLPAEALLLLPDVLLESLPELLLLPVPPESLEPPELPVLFELPELPVLFDPPELPIRCRTDVFGTRIA